MMRYYLLPEPIVLEVSGKDAPRYLNNRLSCDLRNASNSQEFLGAALSPQGRTEGLFAIKSLEGKFILYCDAGERAEVIKAFSRYKVADRVDIIDLSDQYAIVHLTGFDALGELGDKILTSVKRHRISQNGLDIIVKRENLSDIKNALQAKGLTELTNLEFESLRISRGNPQFPIEINSESIILETGPAEAVVFGKGCYVGQEVVERVDSIGRLPKMLIRLKTKAEFQKEFPITLQTGKAVGEVVSVAKSLDSDDWFGFGLVKSGAVQIGDSIKVGQAEGEVVK